MLYEKKKEGVAWRAQTTFKEFLLVNHACAVCQQILLVREDKPRPVNKHCDQA